MTIQQLSQETGIGIDTLRIWERRYGFPRPGRDSRGHRNYSQQQLEELRVVKNLQNFGQRPGKILSLTPAQRRELLGELTGHRLPHDCALQGLVYALSPQQIAAEMAEQRQRLGLDKFIHQYAVPLLQLLDHGWSSGQLSIAREHLISDRLENLLRPELTGSEATTGASILFLTLSGERHKLGLLLAAVLFAQEGIAPIWLGEELPLSEVPVLATTLGVTGVALSFSSHYAPRQARQDLVLLRNSLDPAIKLIAGGYAVRQTSGLRNLLICTDLRQIPKLARRNFLTEPNRKKQI